MGLQSTVLNNIQAPRADFNRVDFDTLIRQKGRSVIIESAIKCPCKSPASSPQSNCRNCGGTGWFFVSPRESRLVISGYDARTEQAGWSEELRGLISVTGSPEEELSYMDRITTLDGDAIYCEVLHFKRYGTTQFAYTAYNIKSIISIGLFDGVTNPIKALVEGDDYTYSNNTIILDNAYIGQDLSITIRYKYAPQFLVLEHKRETIQSFKIGVNGKEINQNLPVHAYAKRAHYILSDQNLASNKLLNNDHLLIKSSC